MKFLYVLVAVLVSIPTISNAGKSEIGKEFYSEASYPSASQCASCHQQIYNEWASSNHAYASISPMFHKFEQAVNAYFQGQGQGK